MEDGVGSLLIKNMKMNKISYSFGHLNSYGKSLSISYELRSIKANLKSGLNQFLLIFSCIEFILYTCWRWK